MLPLRSAVAAITLASLLAANAMPTLAQTASPKKTVTDETQLPRFSYPMTLAPSKLFAADDATFAPFAASVAADVDRTLATYDISDKATLADYIATKLALQMLARDLTGARASVTALRAVQTKAALGLLAGRGFLAYIDAASKANTNGNLTDAFTAADRSLVEPLPWDVVQDSIKESYASDQLITRAAMAGSIEHYVDPIAAKTGTVDGPIARRLVQSRASLEYRLPYVTQDALVLHAYIAKNTIVKPDIWAARDVTISASQVTVPVAIGIWDSGVDPTDYPSAMYVDPSHRNGLAFADDGTPSDSDLYSLPADVKSDYDGKVRIMEGVSDLEAGIDSPDAAETRTYMHSLSPVQMAGFDREMDLFDRYSHGSHVAGIAARTNAAARIVVARFDDELRDLSFEPTTTWAHTMAADFAKIGSYFRDHNVRVANMSWGDNVSEFEESLEKNDPNADPTVRETKAKQLYAIWRNAIEGVIASTPQTLFVVAAGNADSDSSFAEFVPASLSYPNLMTVGAVNQAGDPASFTSYGPTVVVYADGYQVPSTIPGGHLVKFSGTSMATPNVVNLAAKLFALEPSLTPVQVRALIIKGSTTSDDGKRKLIDPKATVGLLHS